MYYIIVNPVSKSGNGQKIWETLVPILKQMQIPYETYFTQGSGHASEIASGLTKGLTQSIKLIVVGGDGTVNEVLQGIQDFTQTSVGYIPTGSSNDLARDLHISSIPQKALEQILTDQATRLLDIGQLQYKDGTTRLFKVSCGIGFDAGVCKEALHSPLKKFLNQLGLGKLTYLGIALKQLAKSPTVSCDIFIDNQKTAHLHNFLFISTMVHKYEGGGFMFCPNAIDNDGLLDICVAGDISFWKALMILPSAFSGKHVRFPQIFSFQGKSVTLKTSSPLWVHTDGEVSKADDKITLTTYKEQIQFMC